MCDFLVLFHQNVRLTGAFNYRPAEFLQKLGKIKKAAIRSLSNTSWIVKLLSQKTKTNLTISTQETVSQDFLTLIPYAQAKMVSRNFRSSEDIWCKVRNLCVRLLTNRVSEVNDYAAAHRVRVVDDDADNDCSMFIRGSRYDLGLKQMWRNLLTMSMMLMFLLFSE